MTDDAKTTPPTIANSYDNFTLRLLSSSEELIGLGLEMVCYDASSNLRFRDSDLIPEEATGFRYTVSFTAPDKILPKVDRSTLLKVATRRFSNVEKDELRRLVEYAMMTSGVTPENIEVRDCKKGFRLGFGRNSIEVVVDVPRNQYSQLQAAISDLYAQGREDVRRRSSQGR